MDDGRWILLKRVVASVWVSGLVIALASCGGGTSTSGPAPQSISTDIVSVPEIDLLTAIAEKKVDIVQQHMDAGTNPNTDPIPKGNDLEGAYPLHLAALIGNIEVIQILIDNGATLDLPAKNKDLATPLHWAAFFLQSDSVETLIQAGAPINMLDANDGTPLDAINFIWFISESDKRRLAEPIISFIKDNGGKSAREL